jgi:hypothetical protein
MFKLILDPQSGNKDTQISVSGNILTIDDIAVDFAPLGEGEQCDTARPLIGTARRVDGVITVGVLLQYDSATAEPMQSADPADYVIELTDGPAPDVIRRKPPVKQPLLEEAPTDA